MAMLFPATSVPRKCQKNITLQPRSFNEIGNYAPLFIPGRCSIIARVSSNLEGKDLESSSLPEEGQEQVSVENLPLESKMQMMQMKLEAKLRMKLAKKIRLRRKRLVRKRHLRKKGRWPPSKMEKLKNV